MAQLGKVTCIWFWKGLPEALVFCPSGAYPAHRGMCHPTRWYASYPRRWLHYSQCQTPQRSQSSSHQVSPWLKSERYTQRSDQQKMIKGVPKPREAQRRNKFPGLVSGLPRSRDLRVQIIFLNYIPCTGGRSELPFLEHLPSMCHVASV
jgi:hypothetical protein